MRERAQPQRRAAVCKSQGILAKTDHIDARLLSLYVRNTERLRPCRAPVQAEAVLRELLQAREALVEVLKHEVNQAGHATGLPLLESLAAERRALFERHLGQIEAEMKRVIASEHDMAARAERCAQVQGGGPGTTAADKPRPSEGGRHCLRKLLYMATLSTARHNPVLSAFYRRLREKGNPVKVALTGPYAPTHRSAQSPPQISQLFPCMLITVAALRQRQCVTSVINSTLLAEVKRTAGGIAWHGRPRP